MIPGPAGAGEPLTSLDDCAGVQLAKKICAGCPVITPCLRFALHVTRRHGADYTQGVWGGLTARERDTWRILGTRPRPCRQCGLDCVPINSTIAVCSACQPGHKIRYNDYRKPITVLARQGLPALEVARRLRLKKDGVLRACQQWRVTFTSKGAPGRRPVAECGTLAAKSRHSKHGESWMQCACRHVAWKAGKRKSSADRGNNETKT